MKRKRLKSSKSSAKTNEDSKIEGKFLLKKNDNYFIFTKIAIEILTFQEIISMAESTHIALKNQLYLDAVRGDHFIQQIKVIDGLQNGLEALYSRHPVLRDFVKDQLILKSFKNNLA